jgi:hypothetical protein
MSLIALKLVKVCEVYTIGLINSAVPPKVTASFAEAGSKVVRDCFFAIQDFPDDNKMK